MDKTEIRQRLWDSLELHTIRRDATVSTLLVFIVMGFQGCVSSAGGDGAWIISLVIGAITLLPFWCFWIIRTVNIFRKPEEYFFCKCTLSSVHHKPFLKGGMYFTVVIEDPDGGRFTADTHAIFAAYGIAEPLVENYINRTVTVAYNRETEMVVVIG